MTSTMRTRPSFRTKPTSRSASSWSSRASRPPEMRLAVLLALGLACGHPPLAKETPVNPQVQVQIAALDHDSDPLHGDYTPAVFRLVELGEPALEPLCDELDRPDMLHRMRAQRAVEGISRRYFGFDGSAWPAGAQDRWQTWWTDIGYDAQADAATRAAAIGRLRQWSRATSKPSP